MNLKEEILKLRIEGRSYREIELILGKPRSTISYNCKLMGINEPIDGIKRNYDKIKNVDEINEYYLNHTIEETSNFFNISKTSVIKYVKPKVEKLTDDEKKRRNYNRVKSRRQKLKEMGVEFLGGKCSVCSYNKCITALEFHHIDPSEKDFTIGQKTNISWDKIQNELTKCILLCSNCHRELHYNLNNDTI